MALLAFLTAASYSRQSPALEDRTFADLARADSLLREGKADAALALLTELAKQDPKPAGVDARLGKAYFKLGKFQAALAPLQAALGRNPTDWESLQLLALSYYSVGNCPQALPLLARLTPHLPKGQIDIPYLYGVCAVKAGQWDQARAAFAKVFTAPPDSALAHLMLAKMMVREHLEDKSVPEIRRALELDPRLAMAHFLLGEIYLYHVNPSAALEEFKQELGISPTVWLVYWRLGDAYARLERYDDAERTLKEAIWLNESAAGSYLLLGQVELKKGAPEIAAGFLERAIRLDPQNDFAQYSLAKAYQQLGRSDDANRHFEITRNLRRAKREAEDQFFHDITP